MPVKKSVRLTDKTIEVCKVLSTFSTGIGLNEVNWSGSINDMSEQFKLMIDENTPALSENKKNALVSVFNGYIPHSNIKEELKLLPWHISEGYKYDATVREFIGSDDDLKSFMQEIETWSMSEKIAVLYMVYEYWRKV